MSSKPSIQPISFGLSDAAATLLRAALLVSIPLGCIFLAYLLVDGRIAPLYVVGIVAGGALFVISLRASSNQNALLAAVAAGGLLGFFALPTGTESRIPISLLIVAAIAGYWLLQVVTRTAPKPLLRPSPVNGAVLAFIGANIFSFVWSTLIRDPLVWVSRSFTLVQLAALFVNCLLPLVILIAINKVDSMRFWRRAVWLVLLIGLFGVWSEILGLPTTIMTSNGMRGLFSMWVSGFALALLLFQRDLSWPRRVVLILVLSGFIWRNLVENTIWLSGWVPMLVMICIVFALRSRWYILLGLLIALVAGTYFAGDIYQNVVQSNLDEGSGSRVLIWEIAFQHLIAHPIFGSGPAGYAAYYMTYHATEARSTHNNFFDLLAQTGIVGFTIFLVLMGKLARMGIRNIRTARNADDTFVLAFAVVSFAGVSGALVGMMLGDWVLPFAYNQTISGFDHALITWLLFGGIASLDWLLRENKVEIGSVQ